jgi:hypothetical protein
MKQFKREDLIDSRTLSPAGQEAARTLALGFARLFEPHRDDPGARPFFVALARLDKLCAEDTDEHPDAA